MDQQTLRNITAFTPISMNPRLCQKTPTRRSKACSYLRDASFIVNIKAADERPTDPMDNAGLAPTLVGNVSIRLAGAI